MVGKIDTVSEKLSFIIKNQNSLELQISKLINPPLVTDERKETSNPDDPEKTNKEILEYAIVAPEPPLLQRYFLNTFRGGGSNVVCLIIDKWSA